MQPKLCSKCGIKKPLRDFYNNKISPDGKTYWCRICALLATKKSMLENKEYYKEYDRQRNQTKKRKDQVRDRARKETSMGLRYKKKNK